MRKACPICGQDRFGRGLVPHVWGHLAPSTCACWCGFGVSYDDRTYMYEQMKSHWKKEGGIHAHYLDVLLGLYPRKERA
jgi:hypothetical protein